MIPQLPPGFELVPDEYGAPPSPFAFSADDVAARAAQRAREAAAVRMRSGMRPASPPTGDEPTWGSVGHFVDGSGRAFARGVFGVGPYLDEIAAGTDAVLHPLLGTGEAGKRFDDRYTKNLSWQRQRDEEYDAQYPILSTVLQGLGGVAGGGALGVPARIAKIVNGYASRNLATRVGTGAAGSGGAAFIHGFGDGTDGFENRIDNALRTGALAVPFGAGAPLIWAGLNKTANATGQFLAEQLRAANEWRRAWGERRSAQLAHKPDAMRAVPDKPLRSFREDYPEGAPGKMPNGARLTHDMDGRPIEAQYIVGREVAGGQDVALSLSQLKDIVKSTTGAYPEGAGPKEVGGFGALRPVPTGRKDEWVRSVLYDQTQGDRIFHAIAHELGHALEDLIGRRYPPHNAKRLADLPQKTKPEAEAMLDRGEKRKFDRPSTSPEFLDVKREFRQIYHDLNVGRLDNPPPWQVGPRDFHYSAKQEWTELVAEGLRAYVSNPNYIKTVAPNAAAWLREYVNEHPELNKIIHLNSLQEGTIPGGPRGPAWGGPATA